MSATTTTWHRKHYAPWRSGDERLVLGWMDGRATTLPPSFFPPPLFWFALFAMNEMLVVRELVSNVSCTFPCQQATSIIIGDQYFVSRCPSHIRGNHRQRYMCP